MVFREVNKVTLIPYRLFYQSPPLLRPLLPMARRVIVESNVLVDSQMGFVCSFVRSVVRLRYN